MPPVVRVRPGAKVSADLKPLTVAASPTFSTKRRSALRSNSLGGAGMKTSEDAELEKAAANKFRARPMPDYSRLAQVRCCMTGRQVLWRLRRVFGTNDWMVD